MMFFRVVLGQGIRPKVDFAEIDSEIPHIRLGGEFLFSRGLVGCSLDLQFARVPVLQASLMTPKSLTLGTLSSDISTVHAARSGCTKFLPFRYSMALQTSSENPPCSPWSYSPPRHPQKLYQLAVPKLCCDRGFSQKGLGSSVILNALESFPFPQ